MHSAVLYYIVYLYVWIYTRRLLVQIYSGGYIVWIRVEMSFLLIFSPPFFSLCVNWKRSYMISETHLHPGAQLAKDKSWGTTMSRAFRHFLLPFPFRRLLRCALTTSDRKSQKIKKKKCMGIVCNMQRAEPAQWRWKAQKGGKRRRRGKKKLCTFSLSRCGNVLITSFTPVVVIIMYAPGWHKESWLPKSARTVWHGDKFNQSLQILNQSTFIRCVHFFFSPINPLYTLTFCQKNFHFYFLVCPANSFFFKTIW